MKAFLLSLAAVSILTSLVQSLLPKGNIKRIAIFSGGLLMILTVVSPLLKLDSRSVSKFLSRFQVETAFLEQGIRTGNREILAQIITDRTQAYILDKAHALGLSVEVRVELEEEGDYPYPVAVALTGSYTDRQQSDLSRIIEEDLGIAAVRQEWKH